MNNESRTQKVKSCTSCKRSLPLYFFGLRKCAVDGLNYTCKECRNFKKRQTYNIEAIEQTSILPLDQYNYLFIKNMPAFNINYDLIGLDLETLKLIKIFIGQLSCLGLIQLHYENNTKVGTPYSGHITDDVDFVLNFLNKKKIRLFYSHEINALQNWGYVSEANS